LFPLSISSLHSLHSLLSIQLLRFNICVSKGDVTVTTPFGDIKFAVMPTNTPFLMCLADMDKHGVYLNNISNVLVHNTKSGTSEFPVVRRWGHPWLLIGQDSNQEVAAYNLTETELTQLHRRFGHPAAAWLHKLLCEAGHDDIPKTTIDEINCFTRLILYIRREIGETYQQYSSSIIPSIYSFDLLFNLFPWFISLVYFFV
jgi:hypothetical protein